MALLEMVNKFSNIRYGTGQSQAGILPYIHFERNEELDSHNVSGYTLHCKFFLEGALATMDVSDVRTPTPTHTCDVEYVLNCFLVQQFSFCTFDSSLISTVVPYERVWMRLACSSLLRGFGPVVPFRVRSTLTPVACGIDFRVFCPAAVFLVDC